MYNFKPFVIGEQIFCANPFLGDNHGQESNGLYQIAGSSW